jgi:YEATS domain-containing protein 4
LDNPPYEVSETGWGGFNYDVRLFFRPESTEKPQYRTHYLQLEPFGKDAEKQQKEGLVRAEALEEVNFNEPVDIFAHMLTSESQFDIMRDVKQQTAQWGAHVVKARKKMLAPAEGSAQLSVRASEVAPFTQEQEDLLVRHINEKQAEVDRMLAEENEKKDKIHQKLLELREYMGPAASAQAAKEASGDRVRRR